jgi:hypothetical protein
MKLLKLRRAVSRSLDLAELWIARAAQAVDGARLDAHTGSPWPSVVAGATDSQLSYCRARLLPVWERWTRGNPAMRHALKARAADPDTREQGCAEFSLSLWKVMAGEEEGETITAAIQAGWAVLIALRADSGELGDGWQTLCDTAEASHRQALAAVKREGDSADHGRAPSP